MNTSNIDFEGFVEDELLGSQQLLRRTRGNCINAVQKTRFATWNVNTLSKHKPGRAEILALDLEKHGVAVAGLTEARLEGSGVKTISTPTNNFFLYFSGHPSKAINGVAIAISQEWNRAVVSVNRVNERLMVVRLQRFAGFVSVFCLYAPTEPSSIAAKNDFYAQLQEEFNSIPRSDMIILLGDWNAEIGRDRTGWENVRGYYGTNTLNDNGTRMLQFCALNNLRVTNSFFKHKKVHRITWNSNDNKTTKTIDYFLTNNRFKSSFVDVRVKRGTALPTDHNLLIADIRLRLKVANFKPRHRKIDVSRLVIPAVQQNFRDNLVTKLGLIIATDPSQSRSDSFIKAMYDSGVGAAGFVKRRAPKFPLSAASLEAIEAKSIAPSNSERKRLSKVVRRCLRKDENCFWSGIALELENAFESGDAVTFFRTVKRLCSKHSTVSESLVDSQNTITNDKNACLEIWRSHFETLLNKSPPAVVDPELAEQSEMAEPSPNIADGPPTLEEINVAIKGLKARKAAGHDNIPAELFKSGIEQVAPFLLSLYAQVWNDRRTPSSWQSALLTPIFKKGSAKEPKNYRGIAVLPVIGKILSVIILKRIIGHLDSQLEESQAGFRPGRSTVDNIFVLRQILERRQQYNRETMMAFLDFSAAFDSVDRHSLWRLMKIKGVPKNIVELVKNIYNETICRVKAYGQVSEPFSVSTGVRQGDVLSPLLFLLAVDRIMNRAASASNGVLVSDDLAVANLEYADDIVAIAENVAELQAHVKAIEDCSACLGLKLNSAKCKTIATTNIVPVMVNGEAIETVPSFCYLGSSISSDNSATGEINVRIGRAHTAFKSLSTIWKRRGIRTKIKNRLFDSLVLSSLLYGLETVPLSTAASNRLQTFENDAMRSMLNISRSDRVSNANVFARAGRRQSVICILRRRRLKFLGHVSRRCDNQLSKQVFFSPPPTGWVRRQGGQKLTWRNLVEKGDLKDTLRGYQHLYGYNFLTIVKDLAANRQMWRQIVTEPLR
jgi:exonuclease III